MSDNDNRPVNTWIASGMKLKPRELTDGQILKLNHVEWIDGAVHTLSQETGVHKTPFLLGLITRLGWLSRYVRLLEGKLDEVQLENIKLRNKELSDDDGRPVGPEPV